LSLLISTRDEAGEPMTDEELHDELITLLLAGHETTAALPGLCGFIAIRLCTKRC